MENFSKHTEKLKSDLRAGYLISGFIRKMLNVEEEEELDRWILKSEENMKLFEDLTDDDTTDDFLKWYSERDTEAKLLNVKKRIHFGKKTKVVSIWKYAAAACITGLIAFGIYIIAIRKPDDVSIAETKMQDILPGSQQAILRLSDGSTVFLGSIKDSVINEQVQIENGSIVYNHSTGEGSLHEVSIPRKGYFKLVLPDGSRVWLNSESSISYPSAFTSHERRVTVTGETFFEVAKDATHPFIVSVNGINVQAIGTAFNIRAYNNEPFTEATLIEGSVSVHQDKRFQLLKAGEQLTTDNENWNVKLVDTGPVTAWVQNKFLLKNNTIEEVMRLVERWYDAKVVYKDRIHFHFNGEIDRRLPVSELLSTLEATGHVRFIIDGNTITVQK